MADDRGDRARAIREALGLDQRAMAERMNELAKRLGLRLRAAYDNTVVSKIENGRRDMSVDDFIVYVRIDPEHRGADWLAGTPAPANGYAIANERPVFVPRVGPRPPDPVEVETPRRPSEGSRKRRGA